MVDVVLMMTIKTKTATDGKEEKEGINKKNKSKEGPAYFPRFHSCKSGSNISEHKS